MEIPAATTGRVVGEEWIRREDNHVTLAISRCRLCDATWFPPREMCSTCASLDIEQTVSGPKGVAYASTVVRIGPAAFRPPYLLAYVDVSGARVLMHVDADEALAPGTAVELGVGPIGADGDGEFTSYLAIATPEGT